MIKAHLTISQISDYFSSNKLLMNPSKTKYMIIMPKHTRVDLSDVSLTLQDEQIQRVGNGQPENSTKFLGIHIDEHLTWNKHIDNVQTKISRSLFAINKVKHLLDRDSLETLYSSLIHSHLTYGNLAWGNAAPQVLNKLFLLQKKAIRCIHNSRYNSHTEPLFKKSKIFMLKDMFTYNVALFMYDYKHNILPASFQNYFIYERQINTRHNTRCSSHMYIPRLSSQFSNRLPLHVFPRVYNTFVDILSFEEKRSVFKNNMKNNLMENYKSTVLCSNPACIDCGI